MSQILCSETYVHDLIKSSLCEIRATIISNTDEEVEAMNLPKSIHLINDSHKSDLFFDTLKNTSLKNTGKSVYNLIRENSQDTKLYIFGLISTI